MFKSLVSSSCAPFQRAFLAVVLVVATLTSSVVAMAPASAAEFFTYTTDSNNNVTVTGCVNLNVCAPDMVIPSTLGGNPVTAIAEAAFQYKEINSVTLPSTLTTIGRYAFAYGGALKSITLPSSLKTIGGGAFRGNQLGSVVIPNSVTSMGNYAFTSNRLTSLTLSNSLTTIASSAFQYNRLTSVTIPNSVTYLDFGAFASNELTSVTIPNSVTETGMYVFSDNKLTSVVIPSSMTRIADAAFAGNLLTSVTIPNSVVSIAAGAFSNNKLTSLTLPNSLRAIGYGSFGGNLLTSLVIPASVQEISWYTFSHNLLTSVKFEGNYPGGNGTGVFDNNPDLDEVNVPVGSTGWSHTYDGLLVRYGSTPRVNPSATPKVPGAPVIEIENSRVGNQTITVAFRPPLSNGGSRITDYLVEYKASSASEWTTFIHPASTRANPYVITGLEFETTYAVRVSAVNAVGTGTPSHSAKFTIDFFTYGVDSNNKATITGCVNDGKCKPDLVIPATIGGHRVRAIGWRAFEDKRVTSVVLPSILENIGYNAFAYNGLTSIILPKSLKTIDEGAFYSNALTSLVLPNSVTSVGYQAFRYNKLTSLVISRSLTSIGDIAFANNRLTSLTIPSWVTSVGEWAFSENLLTSVRIPSSVKTLGGYAFATNQLTSVNIPSSLTRIADAAFASNQLTSVNIPQSVTSIGPSAFAGNQLATLRLPNSVAGIGAGAFARNNLTSVVIPASVREISYFAFEKNQLTSIKFAGNYPAYGMSVLDENPGLTEVKVAYGTTGWGATYAGLPVRYVGGPIIQQASAPKIVKAKLQNGQVTLRIWAPHRVDPMGITGYEYTLDNGVTWDAADATSVDKSLVITGLTNGTRYVVKVRAVSGLVRGMPSGSFAVRPWAVPSAPTITALTGQDGSIKVEFAGPASNGGSAITRYAYSVNGKQWFNWGASTSPQVIKALHNRVVCSIRVRALNAAGWGAPSEAVEATPHR